LIGTAQQGGHFVTAKGLLLLLLLRHVTDRQARMKGDKNDEAARDVGLCLYSTVDELEYVPGRWLFVRELNSIRL
jgi:hypothetical protein